MKKSLTIMLSIVFVLLLVNVAQAVDRWTVHHIVKGDTLWGISRKYKVSVDELALNNGIKNIAKIRAGQTLNIKKITGDTDSVSNEEYSRPSKHLWTKKNVDPYIKSNTVRSWISDPEKIIKAVKDFSRMPNAVKEKFLQKLKKNEWEGGRDLSLGEVYLEMTSGSPGMKINVEVAKDPNSNISKWAADHMIVKWRGIVWELKVAWACGNVLHRNLGKVDGKKGVETKTVSRPENLTAVAKEAKKEVTKKATRPPLDISKLSTPTKHQNFSKSSKPNRDVFDVISGAGNYEGRGEADHDGFYAYIKGRLRTKVSSQKEAEYQLGGVVFFAYGEGEDNDWNYDWTKYYVGPTLKVFAKESDYDLDMGVGQLKNSGGNGINTATQSDFIAVISAHANYYNLWGDNDEWLRKFQVNIEITIPLDVDREDRWNGQDISSNEFDNKVVEISFSQSIVDIYIDEEKTMRLTPNINLGFGHEFGNDASFFKIGPSVTFALEEQDVFDVGFLNWKKSFGGEDQIHWLSLTVDGGRAYVAHRASKYKKVKK